MSATQHSVPEMNRDNAPRQRTPGRSQLDLRQRTPGQVMGRFAGAFFGDSRGSKLVPSKWRYLVPPTSTPTSTMTNKPHKYYGNTQSFMVSGTKRSDISRK